MSMKAVGTIALMATAGALGFGETIEFAAKRNYSSAMRRVNPGMQQPNNMLTRSLNFSRTYTGSPMPFMKGWGFKDTARQGWASMQRHTMRMRSPLQEFQKQLVDNIVKHRGVVRAGNLPPTATTGGGSGYPTWFNRNNTLGRRR